MIDFIIREIVCYLAWASAARTFVRVSRQCLKSADPGFGQITDTAPGNFPEPVLAAIKGDEGTGAQQLFKNVKCCSTWV